MATFVPGQEQKFNTPTVTVDGGLKVGTYTFQLIVDDASGVSSAPKTVQVTVVAQPVANFVVNPPQPAPLATFTLDGSTSVSPGGQITSWRWTLLPAQPVPPVPPVPR
jgi:PKD repeat protein